MGEASTLALTLLKLVFTFWLVAVAYVDARTATIPNRLTFPGIALFGGWRVLDGAWYALSEIVARLALPFEIRTQPANSDGQALSRLLFMILTWALCFVLWELHIIGGGDAKTLMAIFALFPSADFGLFLCIGVLVLSLPLLLLRLRGRGIRGHWEALRTKLTEGPLLPTQHELETEGRPYAWTFCLPGVVYLWFLW